MPGRCVASSGGKIRQPYCVFVYESDCWLGAAESGDTNGTSVAHRWHIALLFLAPLALLGGLYALGRTVPVPLLGRSYVVRIDMGEAGRRLDLPPVEGPDDPSRPLVVIDAGHGGHDPGASGATYKEKTIVLGLARALHDQLLEDGGIRVALTRSDDTYLTLPERVEIGRALGADLFVSIHADSAGEKEGVRGASIYTLSEQASSEAAARFAQRENEADRINGLDLSGQGDEVNAILVDLAQRRTSGSSEQFTGLVLREGREAGTLQFHPQPQRSAALGVLRAPDVPSVLFEAGFISNPEDERALASIEGRERFAAIMARAVRIFFARNSQGR